MNTFLAQLRHKHIRGEIGALFAVCSVHPFVLRTTLETALAHPHPVLIEVTANQVNPFGGYSGLTPSGFAALLRRLARQAGFDGSRLAIGADHLGPHVWKHLPAAEAMEKASMLAHQCVRAGFGKLHLDTVQGCVDDSGKRLPLEETARRAARLCRVAENATEGRPGQSKPLYVIGTEVPPPGGGLEGEDEVAITDPNALMETLAAYQHAFRSAGVASAWQRVMAVVVQPGVEFGDQRVAAFDPVRAAPLSGIHARLPGMMTFEVHATDYQTPQALDHLVRGHFPLLKTGPCLTFAMRAALYKLAQLEDAMGSLTTPSRLPEVMENLMTAQPRHWQSHYQGPPDRLRYLRHNSLRDRIRYYWSHPEARQAVSRLMRNLQRPIPETMLETHLSGFYPEKPAKQGPFEPETVIATAIATALQPYMSACRRTAPLSRPSP